MDKIRIGKVIYTRSDPTAPWDKKEHASLREARKANRGNITPCLDKFAQLPKQVVPIVEVVEPEFTDTLAVPDEVGQADVAMAVAVGQADMPVVEALPYESGLADFPDDTVDAVLNN